MPDDQIMCLDAEQPGLVLEVGYSHAVKDLEKKAFRIIKAGKGQIRQVVTVKLHQDSQVDLTVWRPCITSDCPPRLTAEHVDQVIRNTNDEPVPGAQLEIPMAEMAPPKLLPDSLRNETIIITAEELCGIVKRAEDFHNNVAKDRYEDFPTDLEWTLSPASSISTGLSQEDDEQQDLCLRMNECKPAETFRSDKRSPSPIKMRAREANEQD
ncbi:hypothetical protein AYL99_10457 [Fonsecaea erecta]|uniref:Uncharacterized protein n=1 Tax=Fonsecaea erecta TaxID=1367422 RepID=A0A178Z6U0_9EURO|nr:hypothetical protein AYL99_10457 [Fonsecaea erecta]OAP55484.1 hypothetical protein AYL99_10457 [Fonsecaea erecta]